MSQGKESEASDGIPASQGKESEASDGFPASQGKESEASDGFPASQGKESEASDGFPASQGKESEVFVFKPVLWGNAPSPSMAMWDSMPPQRNDEAPGVLSRMAK